jgi:hypothetical protein
MAIAFLQSNCRNLLNIRDLICGAKISHGPAGLHLIYARFPNMMPVIQFRRARRGFLPEAPKWTRMQRKRPCA